MPGCRIRATEGTKPPDRYEFAQRRSEALVEQRQSALQPRVGLDSDEPLPLLGGFASRLVKKVFSGFAIFGLRFLRRDGDPPVRELKRIKRRLLFKTVAFGEVLSVAPWASADAP